MYLLAAFPAAAHRPSDSYLNLETQASRIEGRWDIPIRDLDYVLDLDQDRNGSITWGELRVRSKDIESYAMGRLRIDAGGQLCQAELNPLRAIHHSDGSYAVLTFEMVCPSNPSSLGLSYSLLFDVDPQHRGLARIGHRGVYQTKVFTMGEPHQEVSLSDARPTQQLLSMVREGLVHIALGWDHMLFLLAMLLPSVLARRGGQWEPFEHFRPALIDVVKIVTAFTAAHSLTLTLAALDYVRLPSRFVESAIAASIVIAALNNFRPVFRGDRWLVAFGLGLLHGFGFSSVLRDLGLPKGSLVVALFGFNVGVELGQLAIVAVLFPLAYAVRRSAFYRHLVLNGGSAIAALLGCIWLIERAFKVSLFT